MTLVIGANLPDLDVLAYLDGPTGALAFRRGWTHGILALAVLPFVLTGAMLLLDRIGRRLSRASLPSAASAPELLRFSAVSILTHPILDTLNTYGVRWLMPFDGRWFYGDTLFIVDPWLWIILGIGVVLSHRRRDGRGLVRDPGAPARVALALVVLYAAIMALSGVAARRIVARELAAVDGRPVDRLLLSPLPLTPFRRTVVAAQGDRYFVGRFRWLESPRLDPGLRSYPGSRPAHPAVDAAAATTLGRRFLGWARFPTYRVEQRGAGAYVVHIVDLRYADRPGVRFGSVSIPVSLGSAAPQTGPPAPD